MVTLQKYERLPKPKTNLGSGNQSPVDHFFPFVMQGYHLFILSAFWLVIWELIKI